MKPFDSPLARSLNHLLGAEPWARARLAPFAGEILVLRLVPLPPLRLRIAEDGLLQPASGDDAATLTLSLGAQALPALARGEEHFLRSVEVSGNAQLATEVLFLARHLRWDVEEDLAAWLGDVPAHRLAEGARSLARHSREAVGRFAAGLADYALEEKRMLVRRAEWTEFARELSALRDAVERAEARLARLAGA